MNDVHAMLTSAERSLLRDLPASYGAKSVIEVGSFVGGSASAFAQGMDDGEIVCVDTFCFYRTIEDQPYQLQRWMDNTSEWQKEKPGLRVIPLVGSVTTPAIRYLLEDRVRSFDLAFVDGAHDASSAIIDLACVLPALKSGGILAMHDHSERYGIPFACSIFQHTGFIEPVKSVDSIVVFRRTEKQWDQNVGTFVRGHFS